MKKKQKSKSGLTKEQRIALTEASLEAEDAAEFGTKLILNKSILVMDFKEFKKKFDKHMKSKKVTRRKRALKRIKQ